MSGGRVSLAGVSHRTAPLDRRERFALQPEAASRLLSTLGPETFLLVTCNRTELYGSAFPEELEAALLDAAGGGDPSDFYRKTGREAIGHLFAVAAGLDSMVVGEPQILGQVKRAMGDAQGAGALGPVLGELVRRAISAGRRARRETDLGRGLPSIPKVATGMVRLVLGDLSERTLLVVGTGKLGYQAAGLLRRSGASRVVVTNRSPEAALRLAGEIGGRAAPFADLDALLVDADIVITCTAAAAPILTRDRLAEAMTAREGRKLVLIDIAVPRDVEPSARSLRGVRLYDLDDLRGWGSASLAPETIARAQAIVDEETAGFLGWQAARSAVPTIRALRDRAERILEAELASRAPERAEEMREFGRRLLNKILHEPLVHLRDGAASEGETYLAVARDLFGLDAGENGGPRSGE
ncbi:MAG TPA: glutamyl-tRNA reductase [Gemmatimonadota bacterium]|nr:glutamyl-tRNA reductase [Gemmatimonadota bacterium]